MWIFKNNKLTVRCCLQWLVSPTDRSEDRRDVWRTAETDRAAVHVFHHHLPAMKLLTLALKWPNHCFQKWPNPLCVCVSNRFASLNVSLSPLYSGEKRNLHKCNFSFTVCACEECWLRCHYTSLPYSITKIPYLPIVSFLEVLTSMVFH